MYITHFGHSAVMVETGSDRILIDPGTLSSGLDQLESLSGLLLTHTHADHADQALLARLLERNAQASAYVEHGGLADLDDALRDRFRGVSAGQRFTVGTTHIIAVGGRHAVIHPDVPDSGNVGYFMPAEGFFDPGDSFDAPPAAVRVLALPVSGPWQRLSEAADFLRRVRPAVAFPMHEGLLVDPPIYYDYVEQLRPERTDLRVLEVGLATAL